MDELDPYSIHDLLMAHGMMMHGLIEEAGEFRSRPVGVVDQQGNILHFGTLPQYVPDLVLQLLEWTRDSDLHMLIRSCVFHYELELIHPFADGNGRIGRLWHTLLLSWWNPIFAWLPVESIIHDHQQAYYDAINQSNNKGESTCFITFMFSVIKASLMEALNVRDEMRDGTDNKEMTRWERIHLQRRCPRALRRLSRHRQSDIVGAGAGREAGSMPDRRVLGIPEGAMRQRVVIASI